MNFQHLHAVLKRLPNDRITKFSSKKPESPLKYVRQQSQFSCTPNKKNKFLFSLIFKDWRKIDERTEDKVYISEFNLAKLLKKILTLRYMVYIYTKKLKKQTLNEILKNKSEKKRVAKNQ